jgi:translation initiation factor IF-1
MNRTEGIIAKGAITKKLGGGRFGVKLDNGKEIKARLVSRFKVKNIHGNLTSVKSGKITEGDRVKVELDLRDLNSGDLVGFA